MDNPPFSIRPYADADKEPVIRLWFACNLVVPWNNPERDIERKLRENPREFLVLETEGKVAGSLIFGYDGHRGWVNYLAVDPGCRGRGLARALMDAAEAELRRRGCPKINLQVRETNKPAVEFYRRIGYQVDEVLSMGKRLEPDEPLPEP